MSRSPLTAILLIAAIAFTTACGTSPTGRKQILLGSKRDLEAQAKLQYRQLAKTAPLSQHGPTIDYVSCIANAIIDELPEEDAALDWELIVIDAPATNAFVMPGGKIAVFTGIMRAATNQDQLAAVMGHEVAHALANHSQERMLGSQVKRVGVNVGVAAIGGGAWTRYGSAQALDALTSVGLTLPFSRGHESEADILGLRYMANAGFDPRETVQLWKNMGDANPDAPPEFMSTHPSSETRIKDLINEFEIALPLYNAARAKGLDPQCEPPYMNKPTADPAQNNAGSADGPDTEDSAETADEV